MVVLLMRFVWYWHCSVKVVCFSQSTVATLYTLSEGELGPHLTQCHVARGLPQYQIEGLAPLLGRGRLSPHRTQSPALRPASIPSGILMHPAVWLQ